MKRETAATQEVRPAHELPAGKLRVNMSNALVTAAQRLSLAEKRVLSFAVASLNTFSHNGDADGGRVKLSAHKYAEQFGVNPNTAYDQLQACAESIITKQVWWYEEAKRGPKKVQINWLSKAEYYKGEGTVSLWFTSHIAPHLLQLKGQFTTYQLAQASALRSLYSWRLLELLSQYQSTGWRQIELNEFHHAMETPNSYRANFKDCRCWVIAPAVKELSEKDGWLIEWTPIKTGRKVTALRFEFKRDPQGHLSLDG
jgi:plasmid replication initiation protein